MSEATYKIIELVGSSPVSWEEAAKNAVETAAKSLRDLRIAEVKELDIKENDLKPACICVGEGCEKCLDTGYFGRTGIYEILKITEKIKRTILNTSDANEIKGVALEQGMKTLRQDGTDKILKGISTTEEILRVTQV